MRHAELFVKYIRLPSRSPSECRSDDVVHHLHAPLAVPHALTPLEYSIIAHKKYSRFIQLFVFYDLWFWWTGILTHIGLYSLALVKSYIVNVIIIISNCLHVWNIFDILNFYYSFKWFTFTAMGACTWWIGWGTCRASRWLTTSSLRHSLGDLEGRRIYFTNSSACRIN